ncbi:hypothetical protein FB639_002493 [Coemansia asiatica]|nr:hypothetical protein FB639_002493 [Coemansia asiatica]
MAGIGLLSRVRVLAICFVNGEGSGLEGLETVVPKAKRIWFQSIGRPTLPMHRLLLNMRETIGARVSMVHLCLGGTQDTVAVDLVRDLAEDIETLCISRISGGVLGDLVHGSQQQNALTKYPRLRRLVFSVDLHAHLFATPLRSDQLPRESAFPSLQHLHFDDSMLRGAPREEWHAPLFDSLIKNAGLTLRFLTFPIVYNTGRTINRLNCPGLVELRHVKCCWATGPWGNVARQQRASDSTRVLTDIASIPTLRKYVHPSYIARLSDLPAQVECCGLQYLDLFGWPLTIDNVAWVLQTFDELRLLRVTVATSASTTAAAAASSAGEAGSNLSVSRIEAIGRAVKLRRLDVGATENAVPSENEMPQLVAIVEGLPQACHVALFGAAYLYIKTLVATACDCEEQKQGHFLQDIRLFNLDNAASTGNGNGDGSGSRTASGSFIPSWQNAAGNNGWHLVSRLLVE